ncbi:MAG: SagB/ThcOx family dehydrogenase [Kiritimatiellae bacterium]|nr:SagB/ThcOx family dehydrogenase [Kiritimatiellia bacterium]
MKSWILCGMVGLAMLSCAQDTVKLPAPQKDGGMSLMQALANRKTGREFSSKELSQQTLSSLLWAACGINRADGRRTAPTGINCQDTDVYVVLPGGAYRYDHKAHALVLCTAGDHRELIAYRQAFPRQAGATLLFVQDHGKTFGRSEVDKARFGGIHTGAIMQNVYLFCASEGLVCVAREQLDRPRLAQVLKLSDNQKIVLSTTVGYPQGK